LARIRADSGSPPAEGAERFEVLEREVHTLRQELLETQERLDFAERMLAKGPEERRLGR